MKKSLFILATAALVLASCNNDVTIAENQTLGDQPQEIGFAAYNVPVKRVMSHAPIQGSTFPVGNTMEVVAYQTDPDAENYFTKTTFKKDASTWRAWDGTKFAPKYWPLSAAKLNFFAVSGADVNNADITIDEDLDKDDLANVNYKKAGATGSYTNATQSDIMYAFGRGYVKQSGNALYFNREDAGADVPVNMVFKHTMSVLKFQVKAADDASKAITINSIKVNGASYTGALKLTSDATITANTGDPTITIAWTPDAAENGVTVPNMSGSLTTTYAPADGGAEGTWASLVIVPQSTGFTSFTVNYTFDGHTYDYTYTPSPVVSVAAGNVYTYKLNFQLHEITISPSVTEWATGSVAVVNIP